MRLIDADKLPYKLGVYESGRQMVYVDGKDIDKTPEAFSYRWIPVAERLPEIGVPVLVTYLNAIDGTPQGDGVAVQLFGENCWYWWEGGAEYCDWEVNVEITHWMPLPEPPSDEDAERETSEVYGEWIDSHVPGSALSECSLCHYDCGAYTMKFCPMCGHPMKRNGGTKQSVSEDRE